MADQTKNINSPGIFELNNGSLQVKISNFGATITSLSVPDKNGYLLLLPSYFFVLFMYSFFSKSQ